MIEVFTTSSIIYYEILDPASVLHYIILLLLLSLLITLLWDLGAVYYEYLRRKLV